MSILPERGRADSSNAGPLQIAMTEKKMRFFENAEDERLARQAIKRGFRWVEGKREGWQLLQIANLSFEKCGNDPERSLAELKAITDPDDRLSLRIWCMYLLGGPEPTVASLQWFVAGAGARVQAMMKAGGASIVEVATPRAISTNEEGPVVRIPAPSQRMSCQDNPENTSPPSRRQPSPFFPSTGKRDGHSLRSGVPKLYALLWGVESTGSV